MEGGTVVEGEDLSTAVEDGTVVEGAHLVDSAVAEGDKRDRKG